MSKRKDILNGLKDDQLAEKYGLIYTCNAGWIDLGHLNPNSKRQEIGAANLWSHIKNEGSPLTSCMTHSHRGYSRREGGTCNVTFPNGAPAFQVYYRQDHAGIPQNPGVGRRYLVKKGLTLAQKKRVALSIFMEVSVAFETLQSNFSLITASGFSQEDLVSDLIGFYIAVGEVDRMTAIKECHPVSDITARKIWDTEGAVGSNKNKKWNPLFAKNTSVGSGDDCVDECKSADRKFPEIFQSIVPARKGVWHKDFYKKFW